MDTLESLPLKDGVMAIADESYFDWAVLPETPSSLSATLSGPSVRLKWDLHGGDPKGTVIERQIGKLPGNESQWKRIAKLENNATQYTDSDVAKGQGAAYRVRTYNDAGESAYSNIIHVMIPGK